MLDNINSKKFSQKKTNLVSESRLKTQKAIWENQKKQLQNKLSSGLEARWFNDDCYFMQKYFEEQEEKLNTKSKQILSEKIKI